MNFFGLDSGLYRFLDNFTSFIFLNLLWIIMCLPIITIFPATAAMFAVVRQRKLNEDTGIFKNFFVYFKENFMQSFSLGIIWLAVAVMFYFNFNIVLQMTGVLKIIMISSLLFIGLFVAMTTIYLFPVMVHYQVRWTALLKNSLLFSISQLWVTVLCIVILGLTALISFIIPISSIIIWSLAVYIIYSLCHRTFNKVESMVEST